MSFEKPSYERNESSAAVSPALSNAADALKKELVNLDLGKLAALPVSDQDKVASIIQNELSKTDKQIKLRFLDFIEDFSRNPQVHLDKMYTQFMKENQNANIGEKVDKQLENNNERDKYLKAALDHLKQHQDIVDKYLKGVDLNDSKATLEALKQNAGAILDDLQAKGRSEGNYTEYKSFLKEFSDAGIITQREFSDRMKSLDAELAKVQDKLKLPPLDPTGYEKIGNSYMAFDGDRTSVLEDGKKKNYINGKLFSQTNASNNEQDVRTAGDLKEYQTVILANLQQLGDIEDDIKKSPYYLNLQQKQNSKQELTPEETDLLRTFTDALTSLEAKRERLKEEYKIAAEKLETLKGKIDPESEAKSKQEEKFLKHMDKTGLSVLGGVQELHEFEDICNRFASNYGVKIDLEKEITPEADQFTRHVLARLAGSTAKEMYTSDGTLNQAVMDKDSLQLNLMDKGILDQYGSLNTFALSRSFFQDVVKPAEQTERSQEQQEATVQLESLTQAYV